MAMRHYKLLSVLTVSVLTACSFAPVYQVPQINLRDAMWKDNNWQQARPADEISRGNWWRLYGDSTLNGLQEKIDSDNPNLAIALARYDQATAYLDQARAASMPSVDAGASILRNRQSDDRPLRGATQPGNYGANTAALNLNYEVDLWGRVRNQIAAGKASAQASTADIENVSLSLHAMLTEYFVKLRGIDAQAILLDDTIRGYERSLALTKNRHAGGISSGLDVSRAETQLNVVRVEVSELRAQRAIFEHAIASLVGEPAQAFAVAAISDKMSLPDIPASLPSTLLQRRPDIAAAERRAAAASARIGIARAAFFPSFSLGASFGYQNSGGPDWLTAPNNFWILGPLAVFNIFDGGLREAQVTQARAALDQAGQEYRAIVLSAFQQVEDAMSRLTYYKQESADQSLAAASAEKTVNMAFSRYREGAANYLEVVTAQTTALQTQRGLLNLQTQRLLASVSLIRALGGGWNKENIMIESSLSADNRKLK